MSTGEVNLGPKYVNNDVVVLMNPGENIIGRFLNREGDVVTLFKPHIMMIRPSANGGVTVSFMPYGDQAFVVKRDVRTFSVSRFVQMDKADSEMTTNFNEMISGIKQQPPKKLIGLGG